ncbi:SAM-dependent methyltransferase [Aeromicrobium chenweiae]|uniref:SAM-dependent methyltransferase n=1 Tax=Aeromicrobium chenweiae TaxID=2079793 RepID=A0A2S0WLG0_9ACTN|nr:class I SAM-dependent methyltransferase [Aeromicrobium chenweiae]AWB92100.1 SAM-dependent methyltransferase [Aeromicrobium chenweiae]TGN32949.1 class I SAM-dependent methyltransferase [Aeromicrobium chenweiae]
MTHSFDKEYWDRIWAGDRAASMGASETNPHLVRELDGVPAGTALDAGCGAGAEAVWLARKGWQVTAVDVAADALAIATERAAASGVGDRVRWVEADLSTWRPDEQYDLVTTHYAHPAMSQLEFYDRIASWVAPAGTLFIVGHLHHDDHATDHEETEAHADGGPPAAASATAATITARLDPAAWEIVTAEESHRAVDRPDDGAPSTLHDVVVRARRRR